MKVLFIRSGNNGLSPVSENQADSLIKSGLTVISYEVIGKGTFGYIKNIHPLKRVIENEKPDILHAHYSLSGYISSLTFSKKPVVVSLMGSDVNYANWFFLLIIRIFVKYFWGKTIVKTSVMKNRLGIDKIHIIPNGVDLKIFQPVQRYFAAKSLSWDFKKRLIIFGSDPQRIEKNFGLFNKSVEKVKSYYPGIEIQLLTRIKREDVYLYYCAADVLVLTSLMEGSPNVIKEAMCCNCPIVSTRVGDVEWLFSDVPGHFLTSHDPDDVADKIKSALEFAGRYGRTNGRQRIIDLGLDSMKVAKKIISIYQEALEKQK